MKFRKAMAWVFSIVMAVGVLTGCNKSEENGTEGSNGETVISTVAETQEESVNKPRIYLEDYNLRVIQGADLDFMVVSENVDTVEFTETDIVLPEGVFGEPMIVDTDTGDYEILVFGIDGKAGRYELTIPGKCFKSTTEGEAEDLVVPFSIDNKNISDKVKLTCTPSAKVVENDGTISCLLEYEGDIASYNLGNISVTCHGFTADVNVSLSETSDTHMLVLSNIVRGTEGEPTYFDICEGTVYDSENKPCNEFIVDIDIVDELNETEVTIY